MILLAESDVSIKKRDNWAKWFKSAFAAAGYKSQEEFAESAKCSRVQVQRWIAGDARPREDSMPGIVDALKSVAKPREVYNAAGHTYPEDECMPARPLFGHTPVDTSRDGRGIEYATKEDVQEIKDLLRQLLESGVMFVTKDSPPSDAGLSEEDLHRRVAVDLAPAVSDAKRRKADTAQPQAKQDLTEKDAPTQARSKIGD